MHALSSSFVLGYHGCDKKVGEKILAGEKFRPSENEYDWLGSGIYFWEANPKRGLEFARELIGRKKSKSKVADPFVIGAVIDLRLCLDLTTSAGIAVVRSAYESLEGFMKKADKPIPINNNDGLRRNLDCAVINLTHEIRRSNKEAEIDTVKGIFIEGGPIYPGAGFHEKTHIQISVRNPDCIKGVFRVSNNLIA